MPIFVSRMLPDFARDATTNRNSDKFSNEFRTPLSPDWQGGD